ncbi:hypothetical protein D3093_33150 (plasmid) [Azospirillum argentinense]|uniref:Nucleoside phosphorylase domain-containing protein n=1 Tax=Azospirillum argentinense TaxID=2970906 RepID=A0A4D8PXD2_9PROT|nr:hypothetical protein [Azospirillum argentinense]QCO00106.1 hypothetical protein D3093_33150 [Azospirillum argentinense]
MPPVEPDFARHIIEHGTTEEDYGPRLAPPAHAAALADLGLPWPAGTAPIPVPLDLEPDPDDRLPSADVLVVTWTVDEVTALADVFTPGFDRKSWYRYARLFQSHYKPLIRDGAPARRANRLGSYFQADVAGVRLLLYKSELHLNQDGIRTAPGKATLPVKDMLRQLIDEVQPRLVITVGTAGATFPPDRVTTVNGMTCPPHELGDVMITRGAKFRLSQEFANEAFAHMAYHSEFSIPQTRLTAVNELLAVHAPKLREPGLGPPSTKYGWPTGGLVPGHTNTPNLLIDGRDFPAFHPMLSTDFFEFGTSTNGLEQEGCGVEMGDAVLGMVVEEMKAEGLPVPDWLVIRNASDPQINGKLPDRNDPSIHSAMRRKLDMQAHWAVWYYETYGYWTSVNSAIAVWAVVA